MSYQVFLAKNDKLIICQVSGEMTVDTVRQFATEIDSLGREKKVKRFLINVRHSPNISSIFQNYNFIYSDMQKLGFQKNAFTTILVNAGDHTHDFIETVSLNVGYNVNIFDDEAKAIKWLIEEG